MLGWVLLLVVVVAAVLLVVAEFSTISYRTIGIGACSDRVSADVCRTSGHASHAFALLVLAPLALVMGWGAIVGRSRAAAMALAAVGVAVLVIALAIDLPKLHSRRGLDALYDSVVGHTGSAFKLELIGAVLLILAGGLALVRPEPRASGGGGPAALADADGDGDGGGRGGDRESRRAAREARRSEKARRKESEKEKASPTG